MFLKIPAASLRLAVFVIASVVLMTIDHRQHHVETVRSALSVVVYPFQYLVNLPVEMGQWVVNSLVTRESLLKENARLREEHLLLSSKLQKFAALEVENQRLNELLESSFKVGERVLVAELLAVELERFQRQIVINKGSREGAFNGQPVVDAAGIMGQIVHVGPFSSTVMLITDASHAIPVQVNRNGLRAVAIGTGATNNLELEYIPNNADIRVGDLIVSSGLGSRFPPGYPVGQVTRVAIDPGEPFAKVTAIPSAKLDRSREVLLVWPQDQTGEVNQAPANSGKS
ncbi:MAG: rod shape-determining protein MreC [Gammaproteobacteria bacterium]|nr:rod shape-determining protein MreC [Gammaproteobacteria bacterium]MCI0590899.1 rod shape-determining protein MreC [Gammaproteobacteria bacterium]